MATAPPVIVQNVSLTPEAVAQVVQQMMPQMAQQMVKEMSEKGLLHPEEARNDNNIDNDLIHVFDEARLDEDHHDHRLKLEHVVHWKNGSADLRFSRNPISSKLYLCPRILPDRETKSAVGG